MVKFVLDCMGGDHSPEANIEGALKAMEEMKDLSLIFCGNEELLKEKLKNYRNVDYERIEFLNADDVIAQDESAVDAFSRKSESSLTKSITLLRKDDTVKGVISLGNSGAILAGAFMKIGRIHGVLRPAFCPVLPTMPGGLVGICDSGANVDCKPEYLAQFARMGSIYMNKAYGIESPKVALLNVGVEDHKGDELRKAAFPLIKNDTSVNFVGNMESRDFLSGKYDLVVCDGFAGNVLIKSTEGACLEMLKLLKKTFMSSLKNKIGALIMKKSVYEIKDRMDYNNYGGAILLGVRKIVVKAHGNAKKEAVYHSVKLAYTLEKNNFIASLSETFEQDTVSE